MSDKPASHSRVLEGCIFSCLGSLVTLILLGVGFLLLVYILIPDVSKFENNNISQKIIQGDPGHNDGVIAVIDISGVIASGNGGGLVSCYDVQEIVNHILDENGDNLAAVIVTVDSPGGEVTASDIIYHAIDKIRECGIPVIVQMESMAASGGYYISCQADHIICNPTTFTGSIGVIISGINLEEGMSRLGIKNQVYKSGDFKDMLSATREPTEAENEYIQAMVNESYQRFVGLVSDGRGISIEKLNQMNAIDGRVISGQEAFKMGLVDSLGYWDDALQKAISMSGASRPAVIHYWREPSFGDILRNMGMEAQSPKKISIEIGNTSYPALKPGIPYLLPASHVTGSISQQ